MLSSAVKGVADALGAAGDDEFTARLTRFTHLGARYLAALSADLREKMIGIVLDELCALRVVNSTARAGEINPRATARAIESISRTITSASDIERASWGHSAARKIPRACVKIVSRALDALPRVGTILELAPAGCEFIARDALGTRDSSARVIHESRDLPSLADWTATASARDIQTIIINAVGLRALTYVFAEFARAMVARNPAVFVIMVHDADIVINFFLAIVTTRVGCASGEGIALTIISDSEKKIVSVSDIVGID